MTPLLSVSAKVRPGGGEGSGIGVPTRCSCSRGSGANATRVDALWDRVGELKEKEDVPESVLLRIASGMGYRDGVATATLPLSFSRPWPVMGHDSIPILAEVGTGAK